MRPPHRSLSAGAATLALALLPGCAWWFFSGSPVVDRSRPVALVETTGGIEFGATTEFGILTLGRSAQQGPCRVHYFLGPTPIIEDGAVESTGSPFYRARIDLRTQQIRVLDRPPLPSDALVAMWMPDGARVEEVRVALAQTDGLAGDLLADPGRELPAGAAIFARQDRDLRFVGLVSARATLHRDGAAPKVYYTFAGLDRVRELLAVPELQTVEKRARFRPDDITVMEPRR